MRPSCLTLPAGAPVHKIGRCIELTERDSIMHTLYIYPTTSNEGAPVGRPSTPILSLDIIATAAIKQVDRTGRLEMIKLAASLGVVPSSLYHHVSGRAAIIEAIRMRLTAEMARPLPPQASWEELLREAVTVVSRAWRAHPKLAVMVFSAPVSDDAALVGYDNILGQLFAAGLPPEAGVRVLALFDAISSGLAFDGLVPGIGWEPREDLPVPHVRAALAAAPAMDRHEQVERLACDMLIAAVRQEMASR